MDPENVIADIQADAAAEVAAVAVAGDSVIVAEVAAVADALEDHAELSEERHEEILEEETWLRNRTDTLLTMLQAMQAMQLSLQTSVTMGFETMMGLLQGLKPSTPEPEVQPAELVPVLEVVEVESEGEDHPAAEAAPAPAAEVKRRRRVI